MKYIGGFFELEITEISSMGIGFHADAFPFQSGRACLNYILQQLSPSKLYLPFYCCDSLIEPVTLNNVSYEFYAIDEKLMPVAAIDLKENEYFIYVDYYGCCGKNVDTLYARYGNKLILDNTQAFYETGYKDCFSFNSARKFFGVPDGAYLYSPSPISDSVFEKNKNVSAEHLLLRLQGDQANAFISFQKNEDRINCELKKMSVFSEEILNSLDYKKVAKIRRENFNYFQERLDSVNVFKVVLGKDDVPHSFPFLPEREINRSLFYESGIFIPMFWNDAVKRNSEGYNYERDLSKRMLPLPVDHRYGRNDCEIVVKKIKNILSQHTRL